MAECIVQRTDGYTVMSNHHLRDMNLSLKAKGLLSLILSLPKEWDYTIRGLAAICHEGKQAVGAALTELEKAGYIERHKITEGGKFAGNQYIIREVPVVPCPENRDTDNPATENPAPENPAPGNQAEIIKDQSSKDQSSKDKKSVRAKKGSYELGDGQMDELITQNIGTLGDSNGWAREEKNAVYKLVKEFYAPRATSGKPPAHTARGVGGLFRKLAPVGKCSYQQASDMLLTAIERGWTSVYPKDSRVPAVPAPQLPAADLGEEWS